MAVVNATIAEAIGSKPDIVKVERDEKGSGETVKDEQSSESDSAEDIIAQNRRWILFSLEFFVAAALGVKTEKEVRAVVDKAMSDAHAARRHIIAQGGLHVDVDACTFPRPELTIVRDGPARKTPEREPSA